MHNIIKFFCRKVVASHLPTKNKMEAKVSLAFIYWLENKGFLSRSSEEEVASAMELTREELAAFCRESYGKPFRQLRKELRIREAMVLMEANPGYSLECLGDLVGIPDKSNFRRQFHDVTGYTPSEWKDRMKK